MCSPRYISGLLLLLRISVYSANFALKFPRPLTPTVTLHVKPPRNLAKETLFKSMPCALFHFPYPASPLFAALTKTAGVYTNNSHSGTQPPTVTSPIPYSLPPIPFLFTFLRTLLHFFAFTQNPTPFFSCNSALFRKNTRGWGTPSVQVFARSRCQFRPVPTAKIAICVRK